MSFWKSDTRVAYAQRSIAIPAENGKQFNENAKIVLVVPADVGFFQPSESYLQFRISLAQPQGRAPTRLQLDAVLGGQVLIKNIRVLTGTGILIEEIQDYNVLSNVISCYDTDQSTRNKRSITEGTTQPNPSCRITNNDLPESDYMSCNHNPYFTSPGDGKSVQQWVKLQLPLNTGIFRNKKIFPVVMTTGLRVEIMLEESKKCIRNLISTVNPDYAPRVYGSVPGAAGIPKAVPFTTIALSKVINNVTSVESCPFIVGETITITDGTTTKVLGAITAITVDGTTGRVVITHPSQTIPAAILGSAAVVTSTSVSANTAAFAPKYTLDEVELVLQQIQVPQNNVTAMMKAMKEQGVMKYDFLSYENYKRSQLAGETQSTMALQLNNSQIKSILSIATNSTPLVDAGAYVGDRNSHSLVGVADNITSYQWTYNGVLNPDRRVLMRKLNSNQIEQQHLVELEKALVVGGIPAKSFRKFLGNVIIGRAMALQQGSYDGRGKDFNLQISNEEAAAPTLNKLWMNMVCHVRSINISANGVSLET